MKRIYLKDFIFLITVLFIFNFMCSVSALSNKGDVNGDGKVDESGVTLLHNYIFDKNTDIDLTVADIDEDGEITVKDVMWLRRMLLGEPTKLLGDANGDGVVNEQDLELIKDYYVGKDVEIYETNADMNEDGKITAVDYAILKRMLFGESEKLLGDANGDGVVNKQDLELIKDYYSGKNVEINEANADMNEDGKITTVDYVILKRMLFGEPTKLLGDANGDGVINEQDLELIKDYSL